MKRFLSISCSFVLGIISTLLFQNLTNPPLKINSKNQELSSSQNQYKQFERSTQQLTQKQINLENNAKDSRIKMESSSTTVLESKASDIEDTTTKSHELRNNESHSNIKATELAQQPEQLETYLTNDELQAVLPETFANWIFESKNPKLVSTYQDFYSETIDYDWAIDIQTRISDFFKLHPNVDNLKEFKVTCKSNTCEIWAFTQDASGLMPIFRDLVSESWFRSSFKLPVEYSGQQVTAEFGESSYMLLTRKVDN
ncbi:hypothetical protein [Shewanella sp. TC10]|uniref:hypothetical protein n=1 Tax=Shewanella sp. TC10 TaxID=1419739 RepID=UPI00129E9399|nr:hypothetical protein [Shewanella sp. TC10]